MKKIIILLALLALSFGTFSCGGGAGSSDTPSGENPGIPSVIKLLPAQYVAQTNAFIYLHAKVLDGNGAPVKNVPVTFTNLSSIGNLIIASANTSGKVTLSSTVAKTDSRGIATIKLYSTTDGFATVQAEVNTGAGIKRERKTVYFTKYSGPFLPSLILEVVYGELNYYTLFETETDNEVIVQATVYDQFDLLVYGSVVTFGADWPYKIGSATSCSDGSNACEVTFPNGNTATTNRFGEASVLVRVDPLSLKNITSVLNITASADTGAADIVSLLLEPVTIKDVTVSANPDVVKIGDKSTITAAVTLSTGGPAFDGTGVSFTTCDEATCTAPCGAITPFAQTTDGSAGAEYTAPSSPDKCTVTATAGGKSGTKDINVLATLTLGVIPTTQTISDPAVDDTREFKVVGGTAPYYAYSDNPGVVDVALTDSSTVTATVLSVPTADTTVKITIYDSVGANTSASLILDIPPIVELDVNPPTATVVGIANPDSDASDDVTFYITGGTPDYTVTSDLPSVIASPGALGAGVSEFTVDPEAVATSTDVTLTVTDSVGGTMDVTVTVTPVVLSITLNRINVIGLSNPDSDTSDDITITVAGGQGPYIVTSDNPALTPGGPWDIPAAGPFDVTFDPNNVGAETEVKLRVVDDIGGLAEVTLTIFPVTTGLVISVDKKDVIGIQQSNLIESGPDAEVDDVTFTVTGGTPPYAVTKSPPSGTLGFCTPGSSPCTGDNGPWSFSADDLPYTIDPQSTASDVTVTLTVSDNNGTIASTDFIVHP